MTINQWALTLFLLASYYHHVPCLSSPFKLVEIGNAMGNSQPGIWFDKVEIIMFIRLISDGNKKCGFISFYLFILSVNLMAELARGAKNHVEWSLWINVDHQIIQRENNWEKILYPPTVISWSDEIKRDSILVSLTASLTERAEDRLKAFFISSFDQPEEKLTTMQIWKCETAASFAQSN